MVKKFKSPLETLQKNIKKLNNKDKIFVQGKKAFKFITQNKEERFLFLKQMMKNPRSVGSFTPSSERLGLFISRYIPLGDDSLVVEIGAGTGGLTKALLNAGLSPNRLKIVELDKNMCSFLRIKFPSVSILEGDASHLGTLLPKEWVGNVQIIVSSIPMMNLSLIYQKSIIQSCLSVLGPEGKILQFTYSPLSSLPADRLGLTKKRLGHVLLNFPPATVWQYSAKTNL